MRRRPQFYAGEHWVLERGVDMAADVGGHYEDDGRQHQRYRDVLERLRRIPDIDPPGRTIMAEAPDDQRDAQKRDQRVNDLVAALAQCGDGPAAPLALCRQRMGSEEQDEPQN